MKKYFYFLVILRRSYLFNCIYFLSVQRVTGLVLFTIILSPNSLKLWATEEKLNPELLLNQCELEVQSHEFNGSCLILGIWAKKKNYLELYNRIEGLCRYYSYKGLFSDSDQFLSYMRYYPKCRYVVLHNKTGVEHGVGFDGPRELKKLVRFLNINL